MSTQFKFKKEIRVPSHMLTEIGMSLKTRLKKHLEKLDEETFTMKDINICFRRAMYDLKTGVQSVNVNSEVREKLDIETLRELAHELENHRLITAIKIFREKTGKGLKESKQFFDAFGEDVQTRALNFAETFNL